MTKLDLSPQQVLILSLAFTCSFLGTLVYRQIAIRKGVVAKITFRSLHQKLVPRGGGGVIAFVFATTVIVFGNLWAASSEIILGFGLGGAAAGAFGFLDDLFEIRATKKLIIQIGLGAFAYFVFLRPIVSTVLPDHGTWVQGITAVMLVFLSVWFINLYNFIDGIDGLAITSALFICAAALICLIIANGNPALIFLFALLAASNLGFLFFNLPPASIFMGDAGSIFLGYCLGTLIMGTLLLGQISIWTWLCVLSYIIADTTTTGAFRILFIKKWYGVHRSHAYQNLARIKNSHALVTYGITAYHLLWALPLAIATAVTPKLGPFAAFLTLGPTLMWTIKYGPKLSNE